MFADVIVALATQTTADEKTAQFVDAAAWVPKQMRLNYKSIQQYTKENIAPPEWIAEIKTQRTKEASALADLGGSEAMVAAFRRIGMRGKPAPGEPRGGLANAKPIDPGSAPKTFDPKKRGVEKIPLKHIDDPANFADGKPSGLARSARGHGSKRAARAGPRPSCTNGASATRARPRRTRSARPIPAISSARRAAPSTATRTRTRAWMAIRSRPSSRTRPRLRPPAPKAR